MGIVTLHPIVQKFMDTMVFAQDHKFDRIDLQLVEIGQAQYEINLLKSSEKEEVRKGNYDPWNFEEEDLEEDDYYYEDD